MRARRRALETACCVESCFGTFQEPIDNAKKLMFWSSSWTQATSSFAAAVV